MFSGVTAIFGVELTLVCERLIFVDARDDVVGLFTLIEDVVPPEARALATDDALAVPRLEPVPVPLLDVPRLRVVGTATFGVADAFGIVAFVVVPALADLAPEPALDVDFTLTDVFGVLVLELPPLLG